MSGLGPEGTGRWWRACGCPALAGLYLVPALLGADHRVQDAARRGRRADLLAVHRFRAVAAGLERLLSRPCAASSTTPSWHSTMIGLRPRPSPRRSARWRPMRWCASPSEVKLLSGVIFFVVALRRLPAWTDTLRASAGRQALHLCLRRGPGARDRLHRMPAAGARSGQRGHRLLVRQPAHVSADRRGLRAVSDVHRNGQAGIQAGRHLYRPDLRLRRFLAADRDLADARFLCRHCRSKSRRRRWWTTCRRGEYSSASWCRCRSQD